MNCENFQKLGLSESILKELVKKGFENPTEIQEKIIPVLLKSDIDIIGQAQTGTGKTAAFGLPLIERLSRNFHAVQALILVPTRELAIQVADEINSFKGKNKFRIIPVYGGQSINEQLGKLKEGVDVVVGTPGRVLDHIKRKSLVLDNVSWVVLDEADEMLNMGFIEEVGDILDCTNPDRRTLLFSATMPEQIMNIATKYMGEFELISAKKKQLTTDLTDQIYYVTSVSDKFESLCRVIDVESDFYGLIFCKTKAAVDEVANKLMDRGFEADGIHGDLSQSLRERILEKFRKKRIKILVATDIAARGIDVENLSHVINYNLPQDSDAYVHRIGRTGRAGKKGVAISLISPGEMRSLMNISRVTKTSIRNEKLPGISDVVKIKEAQINERLNGIISSNDHREYLRFAEHILSENDPVEFVAAMLKMSFEDELDEKNYKHIKDVQTEKHGKHTNVNLSVPVGKRDGMTIRGLIKLIRREVNINPNDINEIKVSNDESSFTVPEKYAGKIGKIFGKRRSSLNVSSKNYGDSNRRNKSKKKKNFKR